MAVLDSPESVGTTESGVLREFDLSCTVRKRPAVISSAKAVFDSFLKMDSFEDTVVNASSETDRDRIGYAGGRLESRTDLRNRKETVEKIGNVKDQDKLLEVSKFTYRVSAPAHWRIKESPLSSAAIFKQVKFFSLIAQVGVKNPGLFSRLFYKQQQRIEIKGMIDDIVREAATKSVGFSGREIVKLMASVQAAIYGSKNCVLDLGLFEEVVDYKVAEHMQKRNLGSA